FYGHNYYIQTIAFSANGERLISAGNGGNLRIWDVKLGNPLLVLPIPNSTSGFHILLLEKQKRILTGYKNLYRWDYATPDQAK
ncbi:MAG: WD40 domain-containing protein, partial [Pirellulaceae bacterium]|nr:WD40 domain-containing protein [Pirellulaceae bacterium]